MGSLKSVATVASLSTVFCSAGCASSRQDVPVIPITVGSEQVRVIEKNGQLPSGCAYVTHVQAEDGEVSDSRFHYDGTLERAIQRIRNEAVYYHANTVVLTQVGDSLELPGGGIGSVIWIRGTAYKCPQ
jgi:hypothetical protein